MTNTIQEPFCPLYQQAIAATPWEPSRSTHAGLLFDKFANAWRYKEDRNRQGSRPFGLEFDKSVGPNKDGANEWITTFQRSIGEPSQLQEACRRQRELVERADGKVLLLKNTSRFVTGMGREHPLENGFAWHHTLGVPYLPGSSLKGMLRAWLEEINGPRSWLGGPGCAGRLILLDMLPVQPPQLVVDVMTPHYGPYYQTGEVPGDWHSPKPIPFLVVESGCTWQLGMLSTAGSRELDATHFDRLVENLLEGIEISGVGAKTAVGYGRFERDADAEQQWFRQREEQRIAREQFARQQAEQAAFEASIADASPPLRQLKERRRNQNWQLSAGDQNMRSTLQEFAENNPEPPEDCLDWIRDLLESIPNYKGVWQNPDAARGKAKKPKPKFGAAWIRDLVKRLTPDLPG